MHKFFTLFFFAAFSIFSSFPTQAMEEDEVNKLPYSLPKALEQIDNLRLEGKKLGLFIGRTDKEELPLPEGDNFIWISGDMQYQGTPQEERLHIQMDFKDDLEVGKLNKRFSKVVIDLSTWKFFTPDMGCPTDPAQRFAKLLVKAEDSTLIFESAFQSHEMDDIEEPAYSTYSFTLPISWYANPLRNHLIAEAQKMSDEERKKAIDETILYYEQTYKGAKFSPEMVTIAQYVDAIVIPTQYPENKTRAQSELGNVMAASREVTVRHLRTLFDDAEVKINEPFYKNRYNKNANFFVAKSPK